MLRFIIIYLSLIPYFLLSQSSTILNFENDCMTYHIRLDSNKYELYTTGDGGKNGSIRETGHVSWENGLVKQEIDTLIFYTTSPIEFNSMIELKLKKVNQVSPNKYYFEEQVKNGDSNAVQIIYWEVISLKNEEFHTKIIQGDICNN